MYFTQFGTLVQLSKPFKVFDFDFWRRPESSRETELHIKATNDGTVHAIISWYIIWLIGYFFHVVFCFFFFLCHVTMRSTFYLG